MAYNDWKAEKFSREEEKALVLAMHQGDEDARNRLVLSQAGVIHRCVLSYLPSNHQDFDDMVQLVTIHLLRKAHLFQLHHGVMFYAWAKRVAISKICNHYRSRKLHASPTLMEAIDDYAIEHRSSDREAVDTEEAWSVVLAWLEDHPDCWEKRIVMDRLSGKSLRAIGTELRMSYESVRNRWTEMAQRARDNLFPEFNDA